MKNVRVDLVQNGYEIRIGADLLSKTGVWLHEVPFTLARVLKALKAGA